MKNAHSLDMSNGPLLKNILLFALPMVASGVLQILYNAADQIVVAKWAGGTALAAVGSNAALINLLVNLFVGLSLGANVIIARFFGAGDDESVSSAAHTAMCLSVVCGLLAMVAGLAVSRPALEWMGSPDDVIDQATLYLRIYFLGVPFSMVYNYGAAILRAVGDSRRPLNILMLSGAINVALNLLLVIGLGWSVAGVATATAVSQAVSAGLVIYCLRHAEGSHRLCWKKLRIAGDKFWSMLRYGVPVALQGCVFSLSNIVLQSSINTFGAAGMAGCAADATIEGLVFTGMDALKGTCIVCIGQNIGARKPERVKRSLTTCLLLVTAVGMAFGWGIYALRRPILSLYAAASMTQTTVTAEEIFFFATQRMQIVATTYFLCGLMNVAAGSVQALGAPWVATVSAVIGTVGLRLFWIFRIFPTMEHTIFNLFLCYPISWVFTMAAHFLCLSILLPRVLRDLRTPLPAEQS